MFAAKLDHLPDAGHGETRFSRPWFVIEARVQNAAVVSALVTSDDRLFFQHGDARAWKTLAETPSRCKSNNPAPDYNDSLSHSSYHKGHVDCHDGAGD
jgi:hypothetical protein